MLGDLAYSLGAVMLMAAIIGVPDGTLPLWILSLTFGVWFVALELLARAAHAALRKALDR